MALYPLSILAFSTFALLARCLPHAGRYYEQSSGGNGEQTPPAHARRPMPQMLTAWKQPPAVIAQMFEWTWDSVAAECTNFLGSNGYGFVQGKGALRFVSPRAADRPLVSPAQEHVQGHEWWTDYQPVSYILTSKRGNRAQYQNMIATCHAAGVKVIAGQLEGRTRCSFFSDLI